MKINSFSLSFYTQSRISRILCTIFVLITFANVSLTKTFIPHGKVCKTTKCKRAARSVLERIDFSVNPCDDFYRFACGKFLNQAKLDKNDLEIDSFTLTNDIVQERLRSLLTEPIESTEPASYSLAKNLYKQCVNRSKDEHKTALFNDITSRFDGWPRGSSFPSLGYTGNQSWTELTKEFRQTGYETDNILAVAVLPDLKNSSFNSIYISQPEDFGLDREILILGLDNELVKNQYDVMVEDIAYFTDTNQFLVELMLKETFEFAIELAKISVSKEELKNISAQYNRFTLRQLNEKYPYIQWVEYINAQLPSPLNVTEDEIVVVGTLSYFDRLGKLLQNTPLSVISNYLMYRVIWSHYKMMYIPSSFNRSARCSASTSEMLPYVVSSMYVRKYFDPHSKEAATKMAKQIVHEFRGILNETDWMDKETRQKALQKLDAMKIRIGYTDDFMNDTKIEEAHKNLTIDENSFVASLRLIKKYAIDIMFRKLRQPVEKVDWNIGMALFKINAEYLDSENALQIPAAILQEQFFSFERPWYMNFGAIGSIIGHEITHGFDDTGVQFDSAGQLQDWWERSTKDNFLNRTKCIIDQYENFTEPMTGRKLKGIKTQGEAIADNVGFRVAYLAYQKWEKRNIIEPKLPRLNYTPQQMFWISAAQPYCSVYTKDYMAEIINDEHPPERFRIIGSFSNIEEFANDFKCPKGSPMNRPNKCKVW